MPSHVYTVEEAAAHFCPPSRDADRYNRLLKCIERLWGGAACTVLYCGRCSFGFAHPYVAGDEEFYSILHEQHGYPRWRWDYDLAIKAVIRRKCGGAILDVGAGSGAFLRKLPTEWQKYAVEGSATTRQILRQDQIKVYSSLQEAVESGTKFDVITIFQVLEHLAPFAPILDQCRTLLPSDGALIITVPDAHAMERQEQFTGCADMPPNHVNKWTPKSLALALRNAGFAVGTSIFQPASVATLRGIAHLRILAKRRQAGSLAERAYRIRSRAIRAAFLTVLAGPAIVEMSPHLFQLSRGGAFGVVARVV